MGLEENQSEKNVPARSECHFQKRHSPTTGASHVKSFSLCMQWSSGPTVEYWGSLEINFFGTPHDHFNDRAFFGPSGPTEDR